MKKNMLAAAAAAALLLASGNALAQVYLGGGLGPTSFDIECPGTSHCDTADSGYKLYGGYSFGNGLALEANYLDFGKANADVSTYPYGTANVELRATAIGVGVAASGNFTSWLSGTARLGISQNKVRAKIHYAPWQVASDTQDKTAAYFGLALGFRVGPGVSFTAAADFTPFERNGETFNARMFSIGLNRQF